MGGRSSSSRIGGGLAASVSAAAVTSSATTEVAVDNRSVEKQIRSAKFTDEGFGDWQMDIDRVGGGQVLEETGSSSRALRAGFMPNSKVYGASAWIYDETGQPQMADLGFFNTRREAQSAIKDHILDQRVRRR